MKSDTITTILMTAVGILAIISIIGLFVVEAQKQSLYSTDRFKLCLDIQSATHPVDEAIDLCEILTK